MDLEYSMFRRRRFGNDTGDTGSASANAAGIGARQHRRSGGMRQEDVESGQRHGVGDGCQHPDEPRRGVFQEQHQRHGLVGPSE